MNIYDEAVNKLIKKGQSSITAQKIITKAFQKSGIFSPGSQKFTPYWEKRNTMTPAQRAISRAAKKNPTKTARFKYNPKTGRALVKTQYKKR